jgi:hypothetical protein
MTMLALSIAWGAYVVRQVLDTDDVGPALGAMAVALPAFLSLIGSGVLWSDSNQFR